MNLTLRRNLKQILPNLKCLSNAAFANRLSINQLFQSAIIFFVKAAFWIGLRNIKLAKYAQQ